MRLPNGRPARATDPRSSFTCTSCASARSAPRSPSPASTTTPTSTSPTSSRTSTRRFFGGGGLDRIRPVVAERAAPGRCPLRRRAHRRADRPSAPDPVHRAELPRPRRRDRPGRARRADPLHQVAQHPDRAERRRTHPARRDQARLGGRARHRDRPAHQLPRLRRTRRATRSPATCVVNDVSERAFQMERGGQWIKGKSAETFNPAGPWLVTPDEIDDVARRWTCGWTSTASAGRPAARAR